LSPIHVRARPGDVAPTVLLVGDPGRAHFGSSMLDGARLYNEFRGLVGYTGRYKNVEVSFQTTGMGGPSAAIVCEEMADLGAKVLIRLGTCGGTGPEIRPNDLVIATAACPLDGTSREYVGGDPYAPAATFRVVQALVEAAERLKAPHRVGPVATEDALYLVREGFVEKWARRGVLAQEMEASAIFTVAALRGMEAGCVLTVSNQAGQHQRLPDEELIVGVERMINVGLEAAVALATQVATDSHR
jgi:purine-nucleoside phosphorylase